MTWTDFYLICFLVGFLLSAVSFLFGSAHPHLHVHIGQGHGHLHTHVPKGTSGPKGISKLNFGTATAFLAWFGGAGYLLTRYSSLWAWFALAIAIGFGVAGGGIVFWFMSKLIGSERALEPEDFDLIGALGRLSANIREGGTGEMIFSQQGSRRSVGARSDGGKPIAKGTEVVVTRYEKGIAYVRPWEELAGRDQ